MDQNQQKPADSSPSTEGGSLEGDNDSLESTGSATPSAATPTTVQSTKPSGNPVMRLVRHVNVYLLLFIVVLIIMGAVFGVAVLSNKGDKGTTVKTQTLSDGTLKQIAASDVTVGQPKQVLNVQSNAVFAGKVLVRDSLEVAGTLQIGGILNVPGITVSGSSQFNQVAISKTLAVAGDSTFQGQISTTKNISAAGGATFGGPVSAPQLTINTLQINGELTLTRHIAAGGATPSRSPGSALGGGGSASISGSDTAGSINVNTGSGAAAGCFIAVTFAQKYNATPHVLVTAVGAAAGSTGVYVTRTTTGFSVCAANTPPSNASFGFDYFVVG